MKRGAFAAGRKITRIISFSKKKSSRSGGSRTSYGDPRQGSVSIHSQTLEISQIPRQLIFSFPLFHQKHRLPVGAGEPGMERALVLCVQRLPALLSRPGGPADLPAVPAAERLRGGPWAWTQTPLCLPHHEGQHGDGSSGGKTLVTTPPMSRRCSRHALLKTVHTDNCMENLGLLLKTS